MIPGCWTALAELLGATLKSVPRIPRHYRVPLLDDVGYSGREKTFYVLEDIWEPWVAHEMAHFLVATPSRRRLNNFGLRGDEEFDTEATAADLTIGLWSLRHKGAVSCKQIADRLSVRISPAESLTQVRDALTRENIDAKKLKSAGFAIPKIWYKRGTDALRGGAR